MRMSNESESVGGCECCRVGVGVGVGGWHAGVLVAVVAAVEGPALQVFDVLQNTYYVYAV